MKPLIKVAVFVGTMLAAAAILFAIFQALDVPLVEVSQTTGHCVRVTNPDGSAGDCNRLPSRYSHQWVK